RGNGREHDPRQGHGNLLHWKLLSVKTRVGGFYHAAQRNDGRRRTYIVRYRYRNGGTMADDCFRPATVLALLLLVLSSGTSMAATPPPSRGNEEAKSLADTVRGAEKLSGLVTFYRAPGKLWVEVPPSLLDAPLGLAVNLVDAVGDWLPRGENVDNSLITWR